MVDVTNDVHLLTPETRPEAGVKLCGSLLGELNREEEVLFIELWLVFEAKLSLRIDSDALVSLFKEFGLLLLVVGESGEVNESVLDFIGSRGENARVFDLFLKGFVE